MRCENMKVQLAFRFPCGQPDKNGVIYTKEAVENAISALKENLPITYRDNENFQQSNCLGHTIGETYTVLWDDNCQMCEVIVSGVLYYGGTDCTVKEIKDGVITSFEILSVGLSR